jgi:hypothetical protein
MIIGQIQAVSSAKSVKSEGPQSRPAPLWDSAHTTLGHAPGDQVLTGLQDRETLEAMVEEELKAQGNAAQPG